MPRKVAPCRARGANLPPARAEQGLWLLVQDELWDFGDWLSLGAALFCGCLVELEDEQTHGKRPVTGTSNVPALPLSLAFLQLLQPCSCLGTLALLR